MSQINTSCLGSNGTSIWGPLFSYPYVPPKVPRVAWTQSEISWAFLEWSTEWNLESKRDSIRKSLLPSQKPSNVDFQRSTIGLQGLWKPRPNLRRHADLKKTWARSFPLSHLKCFLVRELMKSNPSNLGGLLWGQRWHQETKLKARLHIPVFRNLFFGPKKPFLPGFLRISFFSCVFQRNFLQERGFGGGRRNSCFLPLSQEFFAGIPVGQEFLYLFWIPPDSSGFLRIPWDSCSCQNCLALASN